LQRKQRQQQDYKHLLVDKLQQKETRVNALVQRKTQLIDYSQRVNHSLQENFIRTTATTQSALLAQPFEQHKKEFDSMKVVKVEAKPED